MKKYYTLSDVESENILLSTDFDAEKSTGVLMSTLWSQYGLISIGSNKDIAYNEYCPIDPTSGKQSVTGCTNTAAGQMLYYYMEEKNLNLALTLNADDAYTSNSYIQIKADGSTNGTISFTAVNNLLSDYDLNSASCAAALIYACGVVQKADYGSESTSTAWDENLFIRAGLSSANISRLYWDNYYYWGSATALDSENAVSEINDGVWDVIIENLLQGLVVGASIPGHAVVIDGYNSSDDTFHVNYGWGKGSSTRWFSRSEMIGLNFREFVFDVGMQKESTIWVNNPEFYGVGTMLRAFEKANSYRQKDHIAFEDKMAGEKVDLKDCITIKDSLEITRMNMSVTVNDAASLGDVCGVALKGGSVTLGLQGAMIVNAAVGSNSYAFYTTNNSQLRLNGTGALIWAGKYAVSGNYVNGSNAVLDSMIQSQLNGSSLNYIVTDTCDDNYAIFVNSSNSKSILLNLQDNSIMVGSICGRSGADDIVISTGSRVVGNFLLGNGNDRIVLSKGGKIEGNIQSGSGNDQLQIDSSSNFTGLLYDSIDIKLNLVAGYRSSSMINTSNIQYLYSYARTITVDISKAVNGSYVLLTGSGGSSSYYSGLQFKITGLGVDTVLSVGGTSSSTYASLVYSNYKLTLTIKNASAGTSGAVTPSGFSEDVDGKTATLSWNSQSNSSGYFYRVGKSSALSGDGVLVSGNSALLQRLDEGTYYYQVRSVDGGGNLSAWSAVQSFVAGENVDLQVTRFASVSVFDPNTALTINYTVKNAGTSTAAASRLYIYVDGEKIGDTFVNSIAAGSSLSGTYTIAAGKISDGTHKIRLVADGSAVVTETNENNNGYTRTIEAVAPADLVVSSFSCNASVPVNEDLGLFFTVKNQGAGVAAASKVYVYADGVKIGEMSISSIAAGGSVNSYYKISKNTLAQGSRRIRLLADGANTVIETDNNNNGFSKSVTVLPPRADDVDLQVIAFQAPAQANNNEQLQLNFTVKNSGSGKAEPCKMYIYNDGVKIGEGYVGSVLGSSTYSGSYLIAAGTLTAGTHKLRLVVDGANTISETNENNNGYTRSIEVTAPADLVVSSFSCNASVAANQALTLDFTVKNNGEGKAGASLLYIYNDGVKIGHVAIGELAAGASYKGSYTVAANTLSVGSHRLRLLADGVNTVIETDNNNNGYSRAVSVTAAVVPKVDLQVTVFSGSSEITDCDALKIGFTVKNAGSGTANSSMLYVYDDGVKIGEVYVGSIAAGAVYSGTYTIAAGVLSAGSNRVRLLADGGNQIVETNENNNGYSRSIEVKPVADLTMAAFSAPASAAVNQGITLNYTVKNAGQGAAAASSLYIYCDGVKIAETVIPALAGGASYNGSTVIAGSKIGVGSHKLRLLADGKNVVLEKDNNNNGYTRSINISAAAAETPAETDLFAGYASEDIEFVELPGSSVPEEYALTDSSLCGIEGQLAYFADSSESAIAALSSCESQLSNCDVTADRKDMLLA